MKLSLYANYKAEAVGVELPADAAATLHAADNYGGIGFHNVSPAQLHDAIGCTVKHDYEAAVDGWICEAHPEKGWPHDDCIGPGMPETNRIRAIVLQRDRYRVAFLQLKDAAEEAYGQGHAGARFRDQIRAAVAVAGGEQADAEAVSR